MGVNSTMHFEDVVSPGRGRAEGTEAREPFAMASLVVGLWRKMRAWSCETMAMARWGYSRISSWLDFSCEGA